MQCIDHLTHNELTTWLSLIIAVDMFRNFVQYWILLVEHALMTGFYFIFYFIFILFIYMYFSFGWKGLLKETKTCAYQHLLQQSLGRCLVVADPPEEQKLAVLNEVWKSVIKLKNPAVSCNLWVIWSDLCTNILVKKIFIFFTGAEGGVAVIFWSYEIFFCCVDTVQLWAPVISRVRDLVHKIWALLN